MIAEKPINWMLFRFTRDTDGSVMASTGFQPEKQVALDGLSGFVRVGLFMYKIPRKKISNIDAGLL
ncbi:MAG: hypothetical protein Q7U74_01690 [Saprospiraceae bacterium]|nr:hypothetical protein [Saprospiraceae bacterium]